MTLNILFAGRAQAWPEYREALERAFERVDLQVELHDDPARAAEVDYIVYAPSGPVRDFAPFTRARAVLNLWAGVEDVVKNPTLNIPLARMVDPGLSEGMVEWVTGHVLRHHLGMDRHVTDQSGDWRPEAPKLARDCPVTVLGLGELGAACARALAALNFPVTGWSRTPKDLPGITCHSGEDGLQAALSNAEIAVLLLPLTAQTENLMDARRLAQLPQGAILINPGRGPLIDDDALLAALDAGRIGHATLDVFRTEPLPADHPYWAHPRVTVTPHIASTTRASTAALSIAQNVARMEAGQPLLNRVDRDRGY